MHRLLARDGTALAPRTRSRPATSRSAPTAAPDRLHNLNNSVRYAGWAVYARNGQPIESADAIEADTGAWLAGLEAADVVVRGLYDTSGMRAGSDLMLWLHGPSAESLQAALRGFRRTAAGAATRLAWSAMGTHRPAEFSRDHIPAFMQDARPLAWLCVYPFVRSYGWYLLPEEERREMLREHGMAGRAFPGVQANTVAAFALGDWEWLLPLEADNLHDLVDLMRDLRATEARRHVREEVPFHTGRRIGLGEIAEVLR